MDKIILVTGTSSGIGEGIARELAGAGAKVLLGARRLDRIEAVAADIRDAGGTAEARSLDVTDRSSMAAFAQAAMEKWGRIDVLVNNAGVMPLSPLAAGKRDEWERMVDVNVKGVLWGIGAVLPVMEAQGSGQIINIGSIGALPGRADGGGLLRYEIRDPGDLGRAAAGKREDPRHLRQSGRRRKRTRLDHHP